MEKELAYQIAHAELTKGQVRLAGYILKNQKRVLGMTALEVGREVGMSDASVIRFCRAVGYSGFANLKVQLQKELSLHSEKIGKHSLYDRFVMQEEKYSKDELDLSEMLTLMGGNLENSLRQNPAATFHTVADKLLSARKKIIIGLRGGKGCAVRFARLLQFLSSDVACISDEGQDELCSLARPHRAGCCAGAEFFAFLPDRRKNGGDACGAAGAVLCHYGQHGVAVCKGRAGGFAGGYRALRLFPFHDRGGGYSGIPADFDVLGTAGELPCKAPAAGRHSGGIPRR